VVPERRTRVSAVDTPQTREVRSDFRADFFHFNRYATLQSSFVGAADVIASPGGFGEQSLSSRVLTRRA